MRHLAPLFAITVLTAATAACEPSGTRASQQPDAQSMPMAMGDASEMPTHDTNGMEGDTGRAMGSIVAIDPDDGSVTIDHGPFEGIGMGAMTMNFTMMGDADLTGLAEGDEVSFKVKRGRDGSYRIMEICRADASYADCLSD